MKLYNELAEYYFALEEKHRDISEDIELIKSIAGERENPALLDLGCGTGEHLNMLSASGFDCTGIDTSESMLEFARTRFPGPIEFIRQDMKEFDFNENFDIIISLFGSFNYITEDEDINRVFSNTRQALKPGGTGIFEVWNAVPILQIREKKVSKVSVINYSGLRIERDRGFRLLDYPNKIIVEVSYNYIMSSNNTIKDRHVMRAFTREEIEDFIINNGFRICGIYANSLKEPYSDTSNAIVVHFQKA